MGGDAQPTVPGEKELKSESTQKAMYMQRLPRDGTRQILPWYSSLQTLPYFSWPHDCVCTSLLIISGHRVMHYFKTTPDEVEVYLVKN